MGRSSKSPDYLLRFWLLALAVTLGLLLLYFLPDNIFGWEPNKVDLLSDLRREQVDSLANKSEDAVALSQQARSTDKKVQERERIHRELEAQAKAATPDSAMSAEKLDSTIHPTSILVDMTPAHDGLQHFLHSSAVVARWGVLYVSLSLETPLSKEISSPAAYVASCKLAMWLWG